MSSHWPSLRRLLAHVGGSAPLGKPAQLLLALGLHDLGWKILAEHESEDIDIEAQDPSGKRWGIECKLTQAHSKVLEAKDLQDLKKAASLGLSPVLAFHRLGPLSGWMLVEAGGLSGDVDYTEAYLRLIPAVAQEGPINDAFTQALERELPALLALPPGEVQGALNEKVKKAIADEA